MSKFIPRKLVEAEQERQQTQRQRMIESSPVLQQGEIDDQKKIVKLNRAERRARGMR